MGVIDVVTSEASRRLLASLLSWLAPKIPNLKPCGIGSFFVQSLIPSDGKRRVNGNKL